MYLFIVAVVVVMMFDEVRRDIKREMAKERNRLMAENNGNK